MEELLEKIKTLPEEYKKIFDRIYEVEIEEAIQYFPENLKEKFKDAGKQKIVVIKNKLLNQESYFNVWRGKREEPRKEKTLEQIFYDPFCEPLKNTPYDDLGRLENEKAITASNLAKISKEHSLIIFKEHNKEKINKEDIEKALELSFEWFEKKNKRVRVLIWNFGFRGGASIIHPHFQVFSFDSLPLKIELIFKKVIEYKKNYNSDYFEDIFKLYKSLELALEKNKLKAFVNLTPFKDHEIIILFEDFKSSIKELSQLLKEYKSLIENFNLLICDSEEIKLGFLVDRGSSSKLNSDIGALEIYAFSVVSFDPLEFAKELFTKFH